MSRLSLDRCLSLNETESTNTLLLDGDFPSGTMVTARHQSAGRGRRGRHWSDLSGRSFLFSLLLEFETMPMHPGLLPLMAGLCVLEAAEAALRDLHPALARETSLSMKWPNDILLSRRGSTGKLAGILLESRLSGTHFRLVTGIGLNWSGVPSGHQGGDQNASRPADRGHFPPVALFPEDLSGEESADSSAGEPRQFLGWLIAAFNARQYAAGGGGDDAIGTSGGSAVRDALWQRFYLAGRRIRTREGDGSVAGLDRDGALLVDGADGAFRYDRTDEEYEIL